MRPKHQLIWNTRKAFATKWKKTTKLHFWLRLDYHSQCTFNDNSSSSRNDKHKNCHHSQQAYSTPYITNVGMHNFAITSIANSTGNVTWEFVFQKRSLYSENNACPRMNIVHKKYFVKILVLVELYEAFFPRALCRFFEVLVGCD